MDQRWIIYYASSACLFSIWLYMGVHGFKSGRVRDYPAFYAFASATAVCLLIKMTAAYVIGNHPPYDTIHFLSELPAHGMLLFLLWTIYRIAGGSWKGLWIVLVLPLYYLAESLALGNALYYRLTNSLLCLEFSLGAAAYLQLLRNPRLCLGRNYGGILAGIFLPVLFSWINHVAYLFKATWWPFDIFSAAKEPVYIACWVLMAWAVRRYDPPTEIEDKLLDQGTLQQRLASAIQTVKGL